MSVLKPAGPGGGAAVNTESVEQLIASLPARKAGGPDARLRCVDNAGAWQSGEAVLPRLLRLSTAFDYAVAS